MTRSRANAFLALALSALAASTVRAHDVPSDVVVHALVKPEAAALRVLVRVPMRSLLDVDFPKRGQDYLDLGRAGPALQHAAQIWVANNLTIREDGRDAGAGRIAALRVSLPSDRSFVSYEEALAHLTGPPLPDETDIPWTQAMLDVLLEYPIRSERSRFAIHPAFARFGIRVVIVLRFMSPGGAVRAFEYSSDPGLVTLDPRWHEAAWTFVRLGFRHILEGADHLLFVFCLVIPLRRIRPLVLVVTSFTIAHSITLLAAAAGLAPDALWFPPLVEMLIAASIVFMALENIVGGATAARRWPMAFAFGLVHGFGFSFVLRETLQFGGSHLLTSLLAFNVGVELGQLLVLVALVPALNVLFKFVVEERMGTIIVSAFVAHTGWHWLTDRAERLRQFGWPSLDPALLASAMRWAMVVLAVLAAIWLARLRRGRQSLSAATRESDLTP